MKPFFKLPLGQRLGAAVVLLLLLLGLSTALSLTRIRQIDQQVDLFEINTLPSVRLLHDLSAGVDDLRGMAALHLVLSGTAELPALESRLQSQRKRMDLRLAACARRLKTAADHRHHAAVLASAAQFWAQQDQLLALSRRAASDPAAATAARLLLTGAAQQAYLQLGADLAAWWDDVERQAQLAAQQAHSDAAVTATWLLALAVAGLLVAGVAAGQHMRPGVMVSDHANAVVSAVPPAPATAEAPGRSPSPADRARVAIGRARTGRSAAAPAVQLGEAGLHQDHRQDRPQDPPDHRRPDAQALSGSAPPDAATHPTRR